MPIATRQLAFAPAGAVPVEVHDPDGQLVFRAHIDIWITQRG